MKSVESNIAFFPSVKLKRSNFISKNKTIVMGTKQKCNVKKEEADMKELIKGYYDGFYKYRKKINPFTVSISLKEIQKEKSLPRPKNGLEGGYFKMRNRIYSNKKIPVEKFNEISKNKIIVFQEKMPSEIFMSEFKQTRNLKVNGRMLKNKMKTEAYSIEKIMNNFVEGESAFETYETKEKRKLADQNKIEKDNHRDEKKELQFRVSPWHQDSDHEGS